MTTHFEMPVFTELDTFEPSSKRPPEAHGQRKRVQAPPWRNPFIIREIYDLSRRRTKALGIPFAVDHVIPLHGKAVSGLHVETNLRIIRAYTNAIKNNK